MQSLIIPLFNFGVQMHIYHLQTPSYAEHVALGDLYQAFNHDAIDSFAEAYFGCYPEKKTGGAQPAGFENFGFKDYSRTEMLADITDMINWLVGDVPKLIKKSDTDLLNMRDDFLKACNQAMYKLMNLG